MDEKTHKGKPLFADPVLPLLVMKEEQIGRWLETGECLKVLLLEKGVAVFSLPGGDLVADAPALVVSGPDSPVEHVTGEEVRALGLYFTPDLINSRFTLTGNPDKRENLKSSDNFDLYVIHPFEAARPITVLPLGPDELLRLRYLLVTMNSLLENKTDPYWTCKSRSCLFEFLFFLRSLQDTEDERSIDIQPGVADRQIAGIIRYLHTHYNEKVSITSLCSEFGTNRTTLSRSFRDSAGVPIGTYLQRIRLRIASRLLSNTGCPLREIADRTGYSDLSLLGRHFKRRYGMTPSEYRKKYS